jgi:hypothetical protein
MGAPPTRLDFYANGKTYDLEICGAALEGAFLADPLRRTALTDLSFLNIGP